MKRLKVRWHTAMNGRDAVTKWRAGGFHLVLMDIQLPVMNGLDATKEIRRLERVNGIGVLADKVGDRPSAGGRADGAKAEGNDRLENQESFKSPVIIVALTASSLQSDRHEALAAGCNDFLTKVSSSFSVLEYREAERALSARQLCLARTESDGMGLHASLDRFRWLAKVERLFRKLTSNGQKGARWSIVVESGSGRITQFDAPDQDTGICQQLQLNRLIRRFGSTNRYPRYFNGFERQVRVCRHS